MSEPFVGEIKMFAGNFAPRGYAFCNGALLAVSQYDALFSLLGTIYGGDGRTTFGLPDLRGRIPVHTGQGPGLTNVPQGQKAGVERVTLGVSELPTHAHALRASTDPATNAADPVGDLTGDTGANPLYGELPASDAPTLDANAVESVGGGRDHENMGPFLAIHFIIALVGIFPSRN